MTTAPTSATSLQNALVVRAGFGDEVRFAAESWMFRLAAIGSVKSSCPWSETLGRSDEYGAYRFGASHNAQTDSDLPLAPSELQAYQMWRSLAQPVHISCDLSERLIYHTVDPRERYRAEFVQRLLEVSETRMAYQRRIEELSRYGVEEAITLRKASERDFWAFVDSTGFSRPAGVVLMDNGDLRAIWKGDGQSHLALHFLGDQSVRYVIFRRRPASRHVSRVTGTDTFDGIKRQVRAFDLGSLVNG